MVDALIQDKHGNNYPVPEGDVDYYVGQGYIKAPTPAANTTAPTVPENTAVIQDKHGNQYPVLKDDVDYYLNKGYIQAPTPSVGENEAATDIVNLLQHNIVAHPASNNSESTTNVGGDFGGGGTSGIYAKPDASKQIVDRIVADDHAGAAEAYGQSGGLIDLFHGGSLGTKENTATPEVPAQSTSQTTVPTVQKMPNETTDNVVPDVNAQLNELKQSTQDTMDYLQPKLDKLDQANKTSIINTALYKITDQLNNNLFGQKVSDLLKNPEATFKDVQNLMQDVSKISQDPIKNEQRVQAFNILSPAIQEMQQEAAVKLGSPKVVNALTPVAPTTNTMLSNMQKTKDQITTGAKDLLGNMNKDASLTTNVLKKDMLTGALTSMMPGGRGTTHQKNMEKLRTTVNDYSANPGMLANHLAQATLSLRQAGLDKVADAYNENQMNIVKLLHAVLPANPEMQISSPFTSRVKVSEVTPAAKARTERVLSIYQDPIGTLTALTKSNQISQFDVAVAGIMAPSTLQKFRSEILEQALQSKPKLNYQQQLSMEILMGGSMNPDASPVAALQKIYTPSSPTPSGGKNKGKLSDKSSEGLADAVLTTSQKSQTSRNS